MSEESNNLIKKSISGGLPGGNKATIDASKEDDCEEKEATRTLQFVVYPSLIAFVVLAGYGFYMVRSLTADVNRLAQTIVDMNQTIRENLGGISENMSAMSGHMVNMVVSANKISEHVAQMDGSVAQMGGDMQQMNLSTQNMAYSTYNMQQDMWSMNKNVSKPFRMMGQFMPFGGGDSRSRIASPPPAAYYYPPGSQYTGYWPSVPVYPQAELTSVDGSGNGQQPLPVTNQQPDNQQQLVVN